VLIAVIAALAAGCTFAVGSVLQQDAARQAPKEMSLSWRLLVDLAHRPRWLAGIGMDVGSFGLQALALAFGPIALVQPLLVTGILFSVPLSVRWRGKRMGPVEWGGTAAVAAGLSLFLVAASPQEGVPQTSFSTWLLVLIAAGGLMAVMIIAGRVATGAVRASLWAVAAGAAFGVLAALTKTSTWLLGQGAVAFFTAWEPYAMAFAAFAGIICQQSAFQAAPLPASMPVMDSVEPTVAVLIGVFAFAESLSTTGLALAGEAVGICALIAGIVVLDRSRLMLELLEEPDAPSHSALFAPTRGTRIAHNDGAAVTDGAQ
jgi:drug/metabolite transporter (DMT)-like permease